MSTVNPGNLGGRGDYADHLPLSTTRRDATSACCQNVGVGERLVSSAIGACLTAVGLSSSRKGSLLLAALGGGLLYRGITGHCYMYQALGVNTNQRNPATAVPRRRGYKIERSITVNCSPAELYSFWREVENLPRVMSHLKRVEVVDRDRSHWVAEGALGKDVEWDAEIYNDAENEMIAWRSLPGSEVDTAGSVHFKPLGEHGAVVTVSMKYDPPGGKAGAWLASLTGSGLQRKLDEDLHRFKEMMETGAGKAAAPSTTGLQPAANSNKPTDPPAEA